MLSLLINIIFLIVLPILVAGLLIQHRTPLPTAAGGIVMSLGIMINDGLQQMPFERQAISLYVASSLFVLILLFFYQYIRDAVNGVFYERHLEHPVRSFATGTWVAGISVTVISILKVLPVMRGIAVALYALNVLLWLAYVVVTVRNYWRFWYARIHDPQLSLQD